MSLLTFGKARKEDALRLSILFNTVYIDTYGLEGVSFEFTNFISNRFSAENISRIIESNPDQLIIAYYKDNPIGAAEVIMESTCPIRKIALPELSKLYVLERFIGQGIGYRLLKEAEQMVKSRGYSEFLLEVLASNQRAVSFYERQGYRAIGHADFVMEVNTYDNLVMTKTLE